MDRDEMVFFMHCYYYRTFFGTPVGIVTEMDQDVISHERCQEIISKWSKIGFYKNGVFLKEKMPESYRELAEYVSPKLHAL